MSTDPLDPTHAVAVTQAADPRAPQPERDASFVVPGFTLGECIGAGGFGEVYRARHTLMARDVAIKVLHAKYSADPDLVVRFIAEARAVAKISHPGIVDIFEFGILPDGRQFCAMELIHGKTLRAILHERTRLPLEEALPILRGIAEAMDAAHAAGVAHRDLKPENVFVLADASVKLIDFGLAKLTGEDAVPITKTGLVFGTPQYMSPEQCRGRAIDARTDLYSFGVLAYHTLTGDLPFSGDALELALHHLNDTPETPSKRCSELDERVDRVLLALLAKDPAERPPSLTSALDSIVGKAELPAVPTARLQRPRSRITVVVGIAAAGVVVGAFALSRGSESPAPNGSECVPAGTKLVGAWDPAIRARTEARFGAAHRNDVDATWRVLSNDLDRYAERWSAQWTAACAAPDRDSDRLLYAQRLTCLDNAVITLRGVSESVAQSDVVLFSEGYIGVTILPALDDCESTSVLRAQSPAPPPEKRDEVQRLMIELLHARSDLRTSLNANRPELVKDGLARLERASMALDRLDVPEAAIGWYWRADMMGNLSNGGTDEARVAYAKAVQRAKELRNDQWLVWDRQGLLKLAIHTGNDGEIDGALTDLVEAVERAGKPVQGRLDIVRFRAQVEMSRGQFERAAADLEAAKPLRARVDAGYLREGIEQEIELDRRADKLPAALRLARQLLADSTVKWGAEHRRTAVSARLTLHDVLYQMGDYRAAREQIESVIATDVRVGSVDELKSVRTIAAIEAVLTDDRAGARAHAEAIFGAGRVAESYCEVTEVAFTNGQFDVVRWAADYSKSHVAELPEARRADFWWILAYAGMMENDLPGMRAAMARLPAERLSWMPLVIDALEGHPERSRRLDQALKPDQHDQFAVAMIARASRDWPVAIHNMELIKTQIVDKQAVNADTVETDAFLGEALAFGGQLPRAIPVLERALDAAIVCCHGFTYTVPIAQLALARALWDTGGDKVRAKQLAEHARDGFARLGKGRETERQAVIRWLAAH